MRAMVVTRFGGPEAFEAREIATPWPKPSEILARVAASGTNPVDAKIRQAGSWAGIFVPAVLGYDVSGVVRRAGRAWPPSPPATRVLHPRNPQPGGGLMPSTTRRPRAPS